MIISQNVFGLHHLKMKNSKTKTEEFSNILTKSKRSALKIESDRGADIFNGFFRDFLKAKNIQHFSRYTDNVLQKVEESLELYVIY